MQAQICTRTGPIESGPLTYATVPDPQPEANQVRIKIKACGVCHSNLHMIEGDWVSFGCPSKLPIIPGHEIVGVIDQMGKEVEGFQVGDRVGVQPIYESCRKCEYCLTGNENLCERAQVTGETVDGGYAEYLVAPHDFVYKLPDNLEFEESAPLFCPGVTAYRAVKRAGIRLGQRVAIVGIGGVGHMSLQFAKLAGAETIAVDRTENQLKLAEELGADHMLLSDNVEEFISKVGKVDTVMVHAPSQKAVDQAFNMVKKGGTILMAVFGDVRVSFPQEYSIITSVVGSRNDVNQTLRIASMGKVRVRIKAYKLSEASDALLKLKMGQIVGKAVLVP